MFRATFAEFIRQVDTDCGIITANSRSSLRNFGDLDPSRIVSITYRDEIETLAKIIFWFQAKSNFKCMMCKY